LVAIPSVASCAFWWSPEKTGLFAPVAVAVAALVLALVLALVVLSCVVWHSVWLLLFSYVLVWIGLVWFDLLLLLCCMLED
jgi:hypothetical protein